MGVEIIFKITAVGILTAVVGQVLKQTGKEEIATFSTLSGLIIVLLMVLDLIGTLFDTVKNMFGFWGCMEVVKIVGIGLVTCMCVIIVKPIKPEVAIIVGICGGILVLSQTINYIFDIVTTFTSIVEKTGLNTNLLKIVLKIVGIGYLCEFSANLCTDTGNTSIGEKIIFAGKILILFISLPIVTNIIDIIMELLPWKNYIW